MKGKDSLLSCYSKGLLPSNKAPLWCSQAPFPLQTESSSGRLLPPSLLSSATLPMAGSKRHASAFQGNTIALGSMFSVDFPETCCPWAPWASSVPVLSANPTFTLSSIPGNLAVTKSVGCLLFTTSLVFLVLVTLPGHPCAGSAWHPVLLHLSQWILPVHLHNLECETFLTKKIFLIALFLFQEKKIHNENLALFVQLLHFN